MVCRCLARSSTATDSDPRTGTFPQMWVTVGDTACNMNEVLLHSESIVRF